MPRKPSVKKATIEKEERPKRVIPSKESTPTSSPVKKSPIKKSPAKASPVKKSPVKKSPAKETATKKKRSTKKRESKPSYEKMVIEALETLGGRREISGIAIGKYIENNFPVPENYRRYLRTALKKAVENDEIVQNKSSYRLAKVTKPVVSKRRSKRKITPAKPAIVSTPKSAPKPKRITKTSKKAETEVKEKPKTRGRSKAVEKESSDEEEEVLPKKRSRTASKSKESKEEEVPAAKSASKKRKTEPKTKASDASVSKPPGLKHDYIWQYQDGTWKNYKSDASDTVEEVYQAYLANKGETDVRAVKSGEWEYMVDFMAMKQTNIVHDNHTTRPIRRVKTT